MSWLKRLFGGSDTAAPPPPPMADLPRVQRTSTKTHTPVSVARKIAKAVPGAEIEDFGERPRDDCLLARVTYVHEGVEVRLVTYSTPDDPDVHSSVWLETKCPGVFGSFDLNYVRTGQTFAEEESRLFLTPGCYVSGARLRNEAARLLSLPRPVLDRLLALTEQANALCLAEEVLMLHFGELDAVVEILETEGKRATHVVALGAELAFLASQFPRIEQDAADLAEARTCRFCKSSFVFAPAAPRCTRCGAPAGTAPTMPLPTFLEVPDDPLADIDEDDPEWPERRMRSIRERLEELVTLVQNARAREESERARIFVEYELDGRPFRAKMMEEYVGVRVEATGARGDFYLKWSDLHVRGQPEGKAWRESERRVFFSEHCSIRSERTSKEVARLASLPEAARARLLGLCEKYQANAQLADGYLAVGLGQYAHEHGMQHVVECSRELASVADAIPRDFDDAAVARYTLASCEHCGWEYFADATQPGCSHCGAPRGAAPG